MTALLLVLLLAFQLRNVSGHIELVFPPGINSKYDPQTPQAKIDYSMTSPLLADGSNYPCKGYNTAANVASLKPVASLSAGQNFKVTLTGTATHEGGSCQFAMSYDEGTTWAVIGSVIGGCPLGLEYTIPIPKELPNATKALFSWTWFNKVGNREMYQNCAVVSVTGGTSTSYTGPSLFRADTFPRSQCITVEGTEPVFPNPGPFVQYGSNLSPLSPKTRLVPCDFDENTNVTVGPSVASLPASRTTLGRAAPTRTSTPRSVVTRFPLTVPTTPTRTPLSSQSPTTPNNPKNNNAYVRCDSKLTWSLCDPTTNSCTSMGAVPAGTMCQNGAIVAFVKGRKRFEH